MANITIKADREYLREICASVKSNKYAIPVFQRDYVWKEEQVLDLFDSISKGYPIGTIILWKPQGEIKRSKDIITDEKRDSPQPEYYILDGRQRLTTFYGCITGSENPIFKLGYNLENQSFEYIKKEKKEVIAVSDVYDTFKLLGKLQQILSDESIKDKAKQYIENAKQMNTILQGYTIGEVKMDNCSLDDARIVFSRINSKGVDISRASMLQATSYSKEGDLLLSDEIDNILSELGVYHFDTLSSDDVLNCMFRFVNKPFYDVQLKDKDLECLNLTQYINATKQVIIQAVRFLHDECYVLSASLLPYSKQLIALTWFFKDYPHPTADQLRELKKWFFYTTYQKSFQNGSMTNTRTLFNRFDDYLKGNCNDAIDYTPLDYRNQFDFRFNVRTATTDLLLLVQIYHFSKFVPIEKMVYDGYLKYKDSSPVCQIPYLIENDRNFLNDLLLRRNLQISNEKLEQYCLSKDIIASNIPIDRFISYRTERLLTIERELFRSIGLTYNIDLYKLSPINQNAKIS